MEEVMTIPMRVDEPQAVPMNLDMEINVGGGAVYSVNGKTGDVVLGASDVGALPNTTTIPTKTSDLDNDSGFLSTAVTSFNGQSGAVTYTAPVSSVNGKTGAVSLSASDVGALSDSTTIPTKVSQLQNDSGFITSAPVSSVNGMTGAVVIGNASTTSAGLMSATDKSDLNTLMDDYSSALVALGVIT